MTLFAVGAAALGAGCGGSSSAVREAAPAAKASCPGAWRAGWQALADRIQAPVYCPGWMPSPLDAKIRGPWSTLNSVSRDRSYVEGFAWQEHLEEVHVNLRGYPGSTKIPTCEDEELQAGKLVVKHVPCFAEPLPAHKTAPGIAATVYTVNQGADMWHLAYVWRHDGSLYMLSEHLAPPLSYKQVVANLDRMLRSLVLLEPRS